MAAFLRCEGCGLTLPLAEPRTPQEQARGLYEVTAAAARPTWTHQRERRSFGADLCSICLAQLGATFFGVEPAREEALAVPPFLRRAG